MHWYYFKFVSASKLLPPIAVDSTDPIGTHLRRNKNIIASLVIKV